VDVYTYQPVCISALHRTATRPPRREWTKGLMVRSGMIRSVLLNNNCGEIQPTQEEMLNRKRLQTIVSLGFVAVLILDAAWLMCG
jgi:hypothetical protein